MRTNLALLTVSGSTTLTGVLLLAYGAGRILPDDPITGTWAWSALVISLGVCGVTLFIAKSVVAPRMFRWVLGALSLLPIIVGLAISVQYDFPGLFAFALPALLCAAYSLLVLEPDPAKSTHDLVRFMSAAILMLLPAAMAAFPDGAASLPFPPAAAWGFFAVGATSAAAHFFRPRSLFDRVIRLIAGGAFLAISLLAIEDRMIVTAVVFAPVGTTLLFQRVFTSYRLGCPEEQEGLSDETIVVRRFESLAELMVWGAFLFTYVHLYFTPGRIALSSLLFGVFVLAYVVFTVQYRVFPARQSNYERFFQQSIVNAVLLGVVCHVTGGLLSPYSWFFIPLIISGSVAPQPRRILTRLYVVLLYFAVETGFSAWYGQLNQQIIVDQLLLQACLCGMTGLYAYHLSERRRRIDESLMEADRITKEALARETAARSLIEHQSDEIQLVKKRDEAILSSLADGVVALGKDGHIVSVNPVAEMILGLSSKEAVGKRLRDLLLVRREEDPEFRFAPYITSGLKGNAIPLPEDLYQEHADGRRTYLGAVVLPILDDERKPAGAVVTLRDVTYLKEVEEMKTSFLSVAAHQLRTPLSTIRWYLELLNDPTEGKLKKNQKMFAENAYASLRRMVNLVNRLLAVTRLESGRVPFRPEPTDIAKLTRDIVESLKRKIDAKGLKLGLDLPALPTVQLDPTLAHEVFVNLLENAIRYTREGGSIRISAADASDEIVWKITDDGIGIPKDQQPKIFEKFFRATNAVDFSGDGNGLGLYLTKFIVTSWGGELRFVSEEGKGTTFTVTVPKAGMTAKGGQVSLNA